MQHNTATIVVTFYRIVVSTDGSLKKPTIHLLQKSFQPLQRIQSKANMDAEGQSTATPEIVSNNILSI